MALKKLHLALLLAMYIAVSAGCGTGSNQAQVIVVTPWAVLLSPGQSQQFSVAGGQSLPSATWTVNGEPGGSAADGTITSDGLYTAPSTVSSQAIIIGISGQQSTASVRIFNPNNFLPGIVFSTPNPLVAAYSITAPAGATVQVQFGTDTSYGLATAQVEAPSLGGPATVLVAGMRAGTSYHMQAILNLPTGSQVFDTDKTFTTGAITAEPVPDISGQQLGVGAPSPGVELFSLFPDASGPPSPLSAVATDLEGNVIWYYDVGPSSVAFPIKLLPNGHFMLNVYSVFENTTPDEIREIDLAGNIMNRIPIGLVNQALSGPSSFQLASFHHDFVVLPNGHLILLGNYSETINDAPGVPPGTMLIGDALVDWDPINGPVWTWSAFDHVDPAHAPYGYPDWTHANAVVYSPDDGNLLLSMRNQNWIIKINYQNGTGDGSVLWHLGFEGDFTLPPGQAPIEWNYGQHYPTFVSSNTSGIFSLMFFDNGNNRLMNAADETCGSPGVGACYSSVPVLQLDESSKTATVLWQDNLYSVYSICCGDAQLLANGDTEFDVAYDVYTPGFSHIEEVTPAQQLVWKMDVANQLAYRGFRIPSLYPGQVWAAADEQNALAKHPAQRSLDGGNLKPKTINDLP
jgi:arylsulfate sulfotransferase